MKMSKIGLGGLVAIAFLAALIGGMSFYTVGPNQRGVLMTWGKVDNGSVTPGGHFKAPFAQTIERFDVSVQKYEHLELAATKDLQDVHTTVAINFQVDPNKVDAIYSNIGNLTLVQQKLLAPVASNAVKAVVAQYNAEDLVENRDKIRLAIEAHVKQQMAPYSIVVGQVNITNFKFSGDYANAIERKQVAQQQALQANYELQRVQTESQQEVAKAEAHAKATLIAAQAEAKAMTLKRQALSPELVQWQFVKNWSGNLPSVMFGGGSHGGSAALFDVSKFLPATAKR